MSLSISRIDEFIKILKGQFPEYTYINAMREDCPEAKMLSNKYGIIVNSVPKTHFKELLKYAKLQILFPCVETGEELPLIIPMQSKKKEQWPQITNITSIAFSIKDISPGIEIDPAEVLKNIDCSKFPLSKPEYSHIAEDYAYLAAA